MELVCVIALVAILVGMLIPAIHQVRGVSHRISCSNNLRQLALACQLYETANGGFPPGTLGFRQPVWITSNDIPLMLSSPAHEFYFRKQQHTSWMVFLLPYLGQTALYDKVPNICLNTVEDYETYRNRTIGAPNWVDGFEAVREVSSTVLTTFLCPADSLATVARDPETGYPTAIGSQPTFLTSEDVDLLLAFDQSSFELSTAPTNYLGCTGAYSGGDLPGVLPPGIQSMPRYQGIFRSRIRTKRASILDGASTTILIGESVGFIGNGKRSAPMSWFFSSLGRARSALEWERPYSLWNPDLLLLGDRVSAYPVGFGSMHPSVCNFAYADGAVVPISRAVDWPILYALAGMRDGDIANREW